MRSRISSADRNGCIASSGWPKISVDGRACASSLAAVCARWPVHLAAQRRFHASHHHCHTETESVGRRMTRACRSRHLSGRRVRIDDWLRRAFLLVVLFVAGCARPARSPCWLRSEPGVRDGYLIEWTRRRPTDALDELCGPPRGEHPEGATVLHLEAAVLRGTGGVHVGARLRRELEPRLLEHFTLDSWTLSCGHNFAIVLNAQKSGCQVDQVIEVVGDYLRTRRANDRIIVMMGLWAAPAAELSPATQTPWGPRWSGPVRAGLPDCSANEQSDQ